LVEGQLTEYTLHRQSSPYDCIRTAYLKTGCLFGSAAKGSGLIANAPPLTARTLYRRGCRAGVAFQLHDDCNEYTSPPDQWTTAHDIIQGQWTLPLIHACGTPHIDHAVRDVQRDITDTKAKQRLVRLMGPSIAAVRHLARYYDQCAHHGMSAPSNLTLQ
jgi:geranylgeranyl pyrophosphate synthase